MAYKAEHTVDLGTQALIAIDVCGADKGDTVSLPRSLLFQASDNQPTGVQPRLYLFVTVRKSPIKVDICPTTPL